MNYIITGVISGIILAILLITIKELEYKRGIIEITTLCRTHHGFVSYGVLYHCEVKP